MLSVQSMLWQNVRPSVCHFQVLCQNVSLSSKPIILVFSEIPTENWTGELQQMGYNNLVIYTATWQIHATNAVDWGLFIASWSGQTAL